MVRRATGVAEAGRRLEAAGASGIPLSSLTRAAGLYARFLKAGMTWAENRSSCSRITASGVPTG